MPVPRGLALPFEALTVRAVPRPASGGANLFDRRAAAPARLARATVDPKFLLHVPAAAVGGRVVAETRALARDPCSERLADAAGQSCQLVRVERAGRAKRVDTRAPERLVDIDVPEACDRSLVDQCGLDRRAPAREPLRQPSRREG